jgi:hypothetical protein
MAGAGAKKFPAFSKLSSADVNDYLADQVIMRFATTTARDAAFGGVGEPTLAEGMTAYIDADNSIYTYDGSNWVQMVSASQPNGLWLVKSQTIGANVASVVVSDCFSAEYQNYKIIMTGLDQTNNDRELRFQLNNQTGTVYRFSFSVGTHGGSTFSSTGDQNVVSWAIGYSGSEDDVFSSIEISNPFVSDRRTIFTAFTTTSNWRVWAGGATTAAASNTGFTVTSNQNITGGTVSVYGIRN